MGILKITPNGASHPGNIGLKKTGGATKRRQQTRQGTAAQLFGQNLNKALAGKQKSTTQQPTKQTRTTIHTAANILNSFSLTASIRSGATENGRFIIAMYQGNFSARSCAMGYRLAYKLGGSLDLIKLTLRGSTVLGTTILRRRLEDNKFRATVWQRSSDGRMVVSVDGQGILSTNDGGFSNPFNGLALINRGGFKS